MSRGSESWTRYVLVVLLLGGAAVGMRFAKARGALMVLKKPLPIRKPLKDFDHAALAPLKVDTVQRLSSDVLQELGTDEYINWELVDPRVPRGRTPRVSMSVTYYTGVQDQVPHVPEECYYQGAFSPAGDEKLKIDLPHLGEAIPVRRLSFVPPREMARRTVVYYTIRVNSGFHPDRQGARLSMKDPFDTHLYYSKVEFAFGEVANPNPEVLDGRARELFDLVLTELANSHWPPKGSERGGPPEGAGAPTR